ncbi:MAG: OsmC family protein [Bdellovibrionaceae bacterium]|nr:OsmC family protein [Pseudobdellovibrionaceae bacterium]
MKSTVVWKEKMEFDGQVDGLTVPMDAKPPLGRQNGATPKELVALGIGGCTAMDVIALLKKHKQLPKSIRVDIDIQTSSGKYPAVFEKAVLTYIAEGEVDSEILKEAVHLSQSKYCGVSAMMTKAFPIEYRIILNEREIGTGFASFED